MENKIRKDNQVQEFLQQTNKDLKKTYDLISNKYPVKCKICKSGDLVEKIYVSGFKLFLCNKCEFLGLYEGLESELNTYFSESKALSTYTKNVILQAKERKIKIFQPLAKKIKKLTPNALNILEIGCGGGLLLDEISLAFPHANVMGIESHKDSADIGVRRGCKIQNIRFEDFKADVKMDVVVFWAVLDHVNDPNEFLNKCFNILKSGGLLIFGNANYAGFEVMIMGPESNIFTLPHRQNFFTPKTFNRALNDIGFSEIKIEGTGELDLFYVSEYLKSKENILLNSSIVNYLNNPEISADLDQFLKRNLLVSHITISATKP